LEAQKQSVRFGETRQQHGCKGRERSVINSTLIDSIYMQALFIDDERKYDETYT
jgi:hypothetical protein